MRLTHLRKRADFLAANRGRRAPMPGFVLLARDRADGDDAVRLGYTVTKKVGNAVVRNRMKRRMRELARAVVPALGCDGFDYVLIGRQGGIERDYATLKEELGKALAKVAPDKISSSPAEAGVQNERQADLGPGLRGGTG